MTFTKWLNRILLPLTCNSVEYSATPAKLSAVHLTTPRCSFSTDAIFRTLDLAESFTTVMPFSPETIGAPFKVHFIVIGRSPLRIMHETPVLSPVLNVSWPKLNGIICGATVDVRRQKKSNKRKRWRIVDFYRNGVRGFGKWLGLK